jgi:hypothetical protein
VKRALLLLVLVIAGAHADQIDRVNHRIELTVGQSLDYTTQMTQVYCDDKTLVQFDDVGPAIRLTGLKEGTTLCGFRVFYSEKRVDNTVYTVVVKPARS